MNEKPISKILKDWRKHRKLTQTQAAIRLNVSVDTLRKWEQETTTPAPIVQDYVRSICK